MKRNLHWLFAIPLVLGLWSAACNDDDNQNPAAPRAPAATATPTPSAAPTASATITPTPSGPQTGEIIGFVGTIQSIQGSQVAIGSYRVVTNDGTEFRRNGNLSSLSFFAVGEDVRVRGQMQSDGSVRAIRIAFPVSF
jgi:hypothetical protein